MHLLKACVLLVALYGAAADDEVCVKEVTTDNKYIDINATELCDCIKEEKVITNEVNSNITEEALNFFGGGDHITFPKAAEFCAFSRKPVAPVAAAKSASKDFTTSTIIICVLAGIALFILAAFGGYMAYTKYHNHSYSIPAEQNTVANVEMGNRNKEIRDSTSTTGTTRSLL